jgi:hypothetical protein
MENYFSYITKLYNEEFHILAGPDVKSIADLAHRRVDVGLRDSGTDVTSKAVFDLLKIPVDAVYDRPEAAIEKLRHGDVAAVALVAGKPATLFQNLRPDDHLHFVAIPIASDVVNVYIPTRLTADDYPGLIAKDQPVDTVAVGSILAVAKLTPGSERYRNVSDFVDVFFTQLSTLLEPGHHPKWKETNLTAELPGWTRFPPARLWLDRNTAVASQNPQDTKSQFYRFLETRQKVIGGPSVLEQQKQDLFSQFQHWQAEQGH